MEDYVADVEVLKAIQANQTATFGKFLQGKKDTPENRVLFYDSLEQYNGVAVMEIDGVDFTGCPECNGEGTIIQKKI